MDVYGSIMQGLGEAVAFSEGRGEARRHTLSVEPVPVLHAEDVRAVRQGLGFTQAVFAALLGVSKKTVEAWEEGVNRPAGSSSRLLALFGANPALARSLVSEG